MWKEREPEYARRVGQADVDKSGAAILAEAEAALIAEPPPVPELAPVAADLPASDGDGDGDGDGASASSKRQQRQQRRQRRRTRPHGRR